MGALTVGCLYNREREQGENDHEGMKNFNTVTIPTNICGPKSISKKKKKYLQGLFK